MLTRYNLGAARDPEMLHSLFNAEPVALIIEIPRRVPLFGFCITVPFLYHCSVFSQGTKTEQCGIVSLFRFFHMELRNSFVFAPLFRFCITAPVLYNCSVFAILKG